MPSMRNMAKRIVDKLPARVSRKTKQVGKKVASSLPGFVASRVRHANPAESSGNRSAVDATDPLRLAGSGATVKTSKVVGRAAAGTEFDPETPERIYRALFGDREVVRTDQGGRPVGGIFGPDLRANLENAGYRLVPFLPGTAIAAANRAETVLLDLEGFEGVWAGSLDATGVGLIREVVLAIRTAQAHGSTCWVIVRGDSLHKLGALALRSVTGVEVIIPGAGSAEQRHFTENPGDAPAGVLDIVRALEVKA